MAMLVMGLFDDAESAQEALRALEDEGFSRNDIDVRSGGQLTGPNDSKRTGASSGGKDSDENDEGVLSRIRHYLSDIGLAGKSESSQKEASKKRASTQAASGTAAEQGARELSDSDILIMVDATDDTAEQAADILGEYGVSDVAADGEGCVRVYSVILEDDVTQPEVSRGGGAEAVRQSETGGRLSAQDQRDFQNDWQARYASSTGLSSDEALPGYQYGYRLGQSPQYSGSEWSAVESQAKRDWDERRFGPWERLKEAVKSGWERAHRH